MNADGRRRFEGKVVVVTGGASGLGEAMSHGFARRGRARRRARPARGGRGEVAEACRRRGAGYACDVADSAMVREVFERVGSDLGDVEVLVNNAGIARRNQETQDKMLEQVQAAMTGGERESLGATAQLSDEDWDRMIRVHLYGTFHCTREALKVMEPLRRGRDPEHLLRGRAPGTAGRAGLLRREGRHHRHHAAAWRRRSRAPGSA